MPNYHNKIDINTDSEKTINGVTPLLIVKVVLLLFCSLTILTACVGVPSKNLIPRDSIYKAKDLTKNEVLPSLVTALKSHPAENDKGKEILVDENGMTLHGTQQGPLRSILLKEMKAFFSFKELTIMCRKSETIIELRVYVDPTIKSPDIFWNRSFIFP